MGGVWGGVGGGEGSILYACVNNNCKWLMMMIFQ